MTILTAAPDTVLQDGREVCVIRASQLEIGDVIVAHERVDLHVTGIRRYQSHGLLVAEYDCSAGSGARTLVWGSFQLISPRCEEASH